MFDVAAVGTGIQIGATNLVPSVSVVNGIFTVQLDFTETSFSGANVFVILIKDRIDLFDTVIFAGISAAYIWRVSKLPKDDDDDEEETEVGPAAALEEPGDFRPNPPKVSIRNFKFG